MSELENGAYIVDHPLWSATYPANVSGDTARIYFDGKWYDYYLGTLEDDGARFVSATDAAVSLRTP